MRKGDYSRTFSGIKFYPLDPRPEDVEAVDIARHLALQCRFNGGLNAFYSVAQHSCLVSDWIRDTAGEEMSEATRIELTLWGLLHDASETWTGDIVRPLKRTAELMGLRAIEQRITECVVERFALSPREEPEIIKIVDARICVTEALQLRSNAHGDVVQVREGFEPLPIRIFPWGWQRAEREFLRRLEFLESERLRHARTHSSR